MKNKFNETGDFGKINSLTQINFDKGSMSEDGELVNTIKWAHPELSRELVLELMGYVNTQEEYEMLQSDLAQLDVLIVSKSEKVKGGATK
jgi:hypothetical protein